MYQKLMQELAKRRGLARKFGVSYVKGEWPYLAVNHPAGAARVVGEAKDKAAGEGQIFLRGQADHHGGMRPSLFRGVSDAEVSLLRKAEQRLVQLIRAELPQDRFELIAVSIDEAEADVAAFQERYRLSFPIVLDADQAVYRAYQTMGVPESLLIDEGGRIVERYVGPREWDAGEYVERIRALLPDSGSAPLGPD